MGAVILFLVSLFHAAVFSGLAYWMAPSPQFKFTPRLAAIWFVVGAILANVVLCAMLFEVYNGVLIMAGTETDGSGLGQYMKTVLVVQPFFAIALYPLLSGVIKRRIPARA
jgi:hypothetical protein